MKNYLLPEDFRKGLIDYLATRPYGEVANAMTLLLQLKEAPDADVSDPVQ